MCEYGLIEEEILLGIVSVTRLNILYPGDIRGYSRKKFHEVVSEMPDLSLRNITALSILLLKVTAAVSAVCNDWDSTFTNLHTSQVNKEFKMSCQDFWFLS